MQRECLLICDNCKKKTIYVKTQENFCSFCRKKIVIEEGMEDLVVALNSSNIITISSCIGHNGDFETTRGYPYVILLNSSDNVKRAESILAGYNQMKKEGQSSWKVTLKECTMKREMFILPEKTERRLEELHQDVKFLTAHIVAFC